MNGAILLILTIAGIFGMWKASQSESGPTFLIYLSLAILAIAFIPGLVYRVYALQRGRYILARDGISLYWGLRREEIPIDHVTWVGLADKYGKALTKPFFRMPGAVIGVQTQKDGEPVEFLAARDANLVMIATTERKYVISPANTADFLQTYRRLAEFGSLTPIQSISDFPTFLLSRSWADRPARILLILSTLLVLGLIIWVSLSIPNHSMIALRSNIDGSPDELVPGIRLLLLPVINTFFFIVDLLMGFFFSRREDTKALSYLMWASSALTSLLFMGGVYFILRAA